MIKQFLCFYCLFLLSGLSQGHPFLASDKVRDTLARAGGRGLFLLAGYRCPVNHQKVINSGHGVYAEVGLNMGRIFSKKASVGVYGCLAMMDRWWNTSF